ncbi:hypothetical protein A3C21_03575 [Candidatus Kaiserbacteria bacterium RIFCSPHIGHO2_02_FULL_59_21]|uniref:Prepilin peptidase n=1 Tax=Candidatus Kaiserbacteria bacterium RIFCSPHIGHO2_02_FULL_59_21 TaxID=1798500 RepID=A0A1F6DZN2_9BACT|nr:MAG: hypothetical protein A2766_03645 [Candidatus Kaiserbacteria bacterium RIFCSPHIGHO2_01_FULL_58_22]OGG66760.1 MAG: hypothetical protein A3C21_03575 [Candidatus Kaiserbacteria bacterium RIFCSPHIGHO2_02_FULL_59_21]OGG80733.1 MAG: hypothetical protein A2952_01010 [Candidatus Kaiserbacteria bacterium RIFCSPLOWO2_01_FULL_59_34]OGG84453.1 MAG: hypothetical protein A3I47_02255 [Candidatus Kaiserbacteria bacterium RIFCSPLOWO2_02_FULL_59_19]
MTIAFFALGLIAGSFLNVLILRHGKRPLSGRSACPHCGRAIAWYDNIPVLSWMILRGSCRSCGGPISLQYPIVEALTGALFALYGSAFPAFVPYTLIALPIIALLVAIALYDLRTTFIPDAWVYAFAGLSFASPLFGVSGSFDLLGHALAGPASALPIFALWFVSRGRWMGFGDVKLALGIGWLLGPALGFAAVMFAFILGAIVSLAILLHLPRLARALSRWGISRYAPSRSYTMKSEVPFGPFLIAACFIIWFMQMHNIQLPFLSIYGL